MKKYNVSPEQKARSEERRLRFRGIAKQIAAMSEVQRAALAQSCPVVTIEGRPLSVHNQCMLAMQNPSVTVVGGFRQWIAAGRCVAKGQHGLAIWIPCGKRETNESGESIIVPQGDENHRFVLGTVFDVSQTVETNAAAIAENEAKQQTFALALVPDVSPVLVPAYA